jgi:hypothetical protein
MRFDQLGGRQRQPLVQRHVFESGRPEEFEEFQRYIAGVLHSGSSTLERSLRRPRGSRRFGRNPAKQTPSFAPFRTDSIAIHPRWDASGSPSWTSERLSRSPRRPRSRWGNFVCRRCEPSHPGLCRFSDPIFLGSCWGTVPCGLAIASLSIGPGTGASKMNSCSLGMRSKASSGTPKFADRTSFGVRANTSLRRKVLLSENEPLGNASRNSQPSGGGPGLSVVSPPGNTKDRPPRRRR